MKFTFSPVLLALLFQSFGAVAAAGSDNGGWGTGTSEMFRPKCSKCDPGDKHCLKICEKESKK